MTPASRRVRVAIIAIIAGAALAVVLVAFGGFRLARDRVHYAIDFSDTVYGLSVGNDVYFDGLQVGNVTSMGLVRDGVPHVRVIIAVDRSTPVFADTRAFLTFAGLTGVKEIDLRGGSPTTPPRHPGDTIPVGTSDLERLEHQATDIGSNAARLLTTANQIADNLAVVTGSAELGATIDDARRTAANFANASASLDHIVADNRDSVRASLASIERATATASEMIADLDRVVHNNENDIYAVVRELRDTTRAFKALSADLRAAPSRLLFSKPQPERKLP